MTRRGRAVIFHNYTSTISSDRLAVIPQLAVCLSAFNVEREESKDVIGRVCVCVCVCVCGGESRREKEGVGETKIKFVCVYVREKPHALSGTGEGLFHHH